MNVSAENRVDAFALRITHDGFLEFADETDRVFHPLLRVGTERPVAAAEEAPEEIDRRIERERNW